MLQRFSHKIRNFFVCSFLLAALLTSCVKEDVFENTPYGNFEALWTIIDQQYCFLDYKHEEYGLDWNKVYQEYSQRITPEMSSKNLFEVLSQMVNELRDGHVNLSCSWQTSQ